MLKFLFDTLLIILAIVLAFSFTIITSLFVVNSFEQTWFLLFYLTIFISGVFGIKGLGRYYVRNFL